MILKGVRLKWLNGIQQSVIDVISVTEETEIKIALLDQGNDYVNDPKRITSNENFCYLNAFSEVQFLISFYSIYFSFNPDFCIAYFCGCKVHFAKCTIGPKKKKTTPIYFNTNYRTEIKLVPIIMDYCLLQFGALKFFLGVRLHGGSLPNFNFLNANPQFFSTKS